MNHGILFKVRRVSNCYRNKLFFSGQFFQYCKDGNYFMRTFFPIPRMNTAGTHGTHVSIFLCINDISTCVW